MIFFSVGIAIVILVFFISYRLISSKKSIPNTITGSLITPKKGLVEPLTRLFSRPNQEIKNLLPKLEEILLACDVGVAMTAHWLDCLQKESGLSNGDEVYSFLKKKMEEALTPSNSFVISKEKPAVLFFVGINGVGKTTTIGKLASRWKEEGYKPLLVAADTFRAAAREQLEIWASRSDIDCISGKSQADPASVIFDGIAAAKSRGSDLVLVDTAGRLQTKTPLMEQLKKMIRVAERETGRVPDETFLILDATTGQNGLSQAKVFKEAIPLSGIILTKYDGTSKGGIVFSVVAETGLPLRFLGVGEKKEDLRPFDAGNFVKELFRR